MKLARYLATGMMLGASLWAALAIIGQTWFWQFKLITLICVGSVPVVGALWWANWWAETPMREAGRGRMTIAEYEAFDAVWLAENGIEA